MVSPSAHAPSRTPSAPAKLWSAVGRSDAFEHWREVVCQAYTKLSPERNAEGPFTGDISMTPVGAGASLSRIVASPQTVNRRREDVAARPCEAVFVNIQVAGTSVVRQREIETRLVPGSFALMDARQPFAMRFDGPFQQVCLHLPFDLLAAHGIDAASAVARRVERAHACAAALMDQACATLEAGEPAGADADEAAGHLTQLLGLCYADGRAETLADRHLKLIRRFVARHSADPALSPASVAGHFRISVRYLHRLFARSGESFGQYLVRCRLNESRRALLLEPERPVLDIALDAGFRNASHFSRTFRRRFGVAPSALRA